MYFTIDFNSDEAYYVQLRNQIIVAIAMEELQDGENLPSVRELAETIGINMHTVNKAYALLRQEGYLQLDRRKGAVVAIDEDHMKAAMELYDNLKLLLAGGICKNISREDVHQMVDEIYDEFLGKEK